MVSLIGMFIMIIGLLNAAWILLWFLLSMAGMAGAKLSKKVGTDNENTDQHIEQGKSFSKDLLMKLIWRLAIALIGFLMYYFGE